MVWLFQLQFIADVATEYIAPIRFSAFSVY